MRALVVPLDVRCVDALELRKTHPVRRLGGWEIKAYAIVHTRFAEALLLDADNVPLRDPAFLFDTPEYRAHGAIFWPDLERLEKHRDIWELCGLEYRDEPEFESGQIVVDKPRCWHALHLTLHLNAHSDFYYCFIYGDKETFHLAWRRLGQEYAMPARGVARLRDTMCQHDFENQRLFQHRNLDKWRLHPRNTPVPDSGWSASASPSLPNSPPAGIRPCPVSAAGSRVAKAPRCALPPPVSSPAVSCITAPRATTARSPSCPMGGWVKARPGGRHGGTSAKRKPALPSTSPGMRA